eukprot:TRINITY_DN44396_c0_g1_i1.p1 TRINITY_DN44396_c0_g1~~TRINITY_DN44396_c0_g1_i1.p1  ORF type:complete len:663 (-),score=100.87 TRINITY_DN44396_c0_g1_i1:64-2052(-)
MDSIWHDIFCTTDHHLVDAIALVQKTSTSFIGLPSQTVIGCGTLGTDLHFHSSMADVICPAHCESDASIAYGASIHPLRSSVCKAAMVDGVLPPSGGRLLVTRVPGVASYVGKDAGGVVSLPATDAADLAFHAYALENADHSKGDVRLLDDHGSVASHGLLEVLTDKGFGTVCGITQPAANVMCKQLGYAHGAASVAKCSDNGGGNCGVPGVTPIAMKNMNCAGREPSFHAPSCTWEPVDATADADKECRSHQADAVVSCWDNPSGSYSIDGQFPEWTARLVDADGNPPRNGSGRLEVYHDGRWAPICSERLTAGDAFAACRSMGYSSADVSNPTADCQDFQGQNLCSEEPMPLDELGCSGTETRLADCGGVKYPIGVNGLEEESRCSPGAAAVVRCLGGGDAAGGQNFEVPAPTTEQASLAPKKLLDCSDSLHSLGLDKAMPGTSVVVNCTGGCETKDLVSGTGIYSSESAICAASTHAGVIGSGGGDVVVTVGHGQDAFFGSKANGVTSADAVARPEGGSDRRSFSVAFPTPELLRRVARSWQPYVRYVGGSVFGTEVAPVPGEVPATAGIPSPAGVPDAAVQTAKPASGTSVESVAKSSAKSSAASQSVKGAGRGAGSQIGRTGVRSGRGGGRGASAATKVASVAAVASSAAVQRAGFL